MEAGKSILVGVYECDQHIAMGTGESHKSSQLAPPQHLQNHLDLIGHVGELLPQHNGLCVLSMSNLPQTSLSKQGPSGPGIAHISLT